MERIAGVANENVAEWANGTTYAADAHVMYLGVQYVSMKNSNTGQNPMDKPLYWLACFNRDMAKVLADKGDDIDGGFAPLHDKRDATNYRAFFQWGKYNFGGAAGRNFQAYGVHLDGQTLTGDADYVAMFNIGETDQYPWLDIVAPVVLGSRALLDSKGRVPRCVDATGGSSVSVGAVQEDAFQGHWHTQLFDDSHGASGNYAGTGGNTNDGGSSVVGITAPVSDGTHGTPRVASETVMKNYSVGLPSILVLVEIV
jgi:hypothetical protein